MNGVCTNVIHLNRCRLQMYGGNYDAFVRTRLELLENQAKRYQWEQDQIAHMKVRSGVILYCSTSYLMGPSSPVMRKPLFSAD